MGDLLRLDDDAEPATASNPATATPNYLHDLLGGDVSTTAPTASAAAPIDLLDLLGGDAVPSPAAPAPPTATTVGYQTLYIAAAELYLMNNFIILSWFVVADGVDRVQDGSWICGSPLTC